MMRVAHREIHWRRQGLPRPERALEPAFRLVQPARTRREIAEVVVQMSPLQHQLSGPRGIRQSQRVVVVLVRVAPAALPHPDVAKPGAGNHFGVRSEEHTSELQSRVDISYAVFCLKKK